MPASPVEIALARVETQIEALRADLGRYFSELSNQEERLRNLETAVGRLSERLTIAMFGLTSLQLILVAVAAWIGSR